jgi:hypothetical protein
VGKIALRADNGDAQVTLGRAHGHHHIDAASIVGLWYGRPATREKCPASGTLDLLRGG